MRYHRIPSDDGPRLLAREERKVYDLTTASGIASVRELALAATATQGGLDDVARIHLDDAPLLDANRLPSDAPRPTVPDEVWAAGVTYETSNDAREEESGRGSMYQDVFENERPELFFKATPSRTVGPGDAIGIRADSEWDVPEPELAVVVARGDIVGYTVGNDMSSRSLEGENPLYLPQAKVFEKCCAIGPCIASPETVGDPRELELSMRIRRDDETVFDGSTSTSKMARSCEELVSYLDAHDTMPDIAVLLTGTSLVPPDDFTLAEGDSIEIDIENIGTLRNHVETV
ncbi:MULTISPECIES: fumarylacetoacetate hydrolase family protein [unclassified Haladaptatus]|uniref:fumarylacetoacetate hydrolase family protein n=1 Tax=unclassified Haladaptatus TaxID=2622732 RepID=UPI00209BFC39|nr:MULTISPECIES: fumarylacetoacetate hydrolase family protein [unclassified Haladaptatus]MCO8245717.1 fumarylacetoacetate hydrolase family protein [Haladaptatus sp. AB643]MCO8256062.1 fumarylacetoacetate hydrolase family protein [Haladaptatus sp. AB618]